jgi:hypothetical protein
MRRNPKLIRKRQVKPSLSKLLTGDRFFYLEVPANFFRLQWMQKCHIAEGSMQDAVTPSPKTISYDIFLALSS